MCLQAPTYKTAAPTAWPHRFAGSSAFARYASSDASLRNEINDEGYTYIFAVNYAYVALSFDKLYNSLLVGFKMHVSMISVYILCHKLVS